MHPKKRIKIWNAVLPNDKGKTKVHIFLTIEFFFLNKENEWFLAQE